MMVPKKSLVLGAALLCLGASASAQDGNGPLLRRVNKPLRPVELDLQTGTITRGPEITNKGASSYVTCESFNNQDHSGFVGVDTGSTNPQAGCEWIDSANKGAGSTGGKSGFVTAFQFAYCSAALDTLSGGPGGSATIGFREGYKKGGVDQGTDVGTFLLTGLPANTNCSSFFGGFNCFLITVSFGQTPLCLPDGCIGWSWKFSDVGTDGVLAKTFPFLSCVQSCSGPGPDGTGGMTDCIDQYCPPGQLLSTFTFGTTPYGSFFTSIDMTLREAPAILATSNTVPGCAGQPNQLVNCSTTAGADKNAPILNQNWKLCLDCSGTAKNKPAIFRISFGPPRPTTASSFGPICVDVRAGRGQTFVAGKNQTNCMAMLGPFPLPKNLSFFGACFTVQGFCGDDPKGSTSTALQEVIGSC